MGHSKNFQTDFLTPRSSFLVGMGSVLNLGGNYFGYNESESEGKADERAIACDWKMIGQDVRQVLVSPESALACK
jgi:hypothetical protein